MSTLQQLRTNLSDPEVKAEWKESVQFSKALSISEIDRILEVVFSDGKPGHKKIIDECLDAAWDRHIKNQMESLYEALADDRRN